MLKHCICCTGNLSEEICYFTEGKYFSKSGSALHCLKCGQFFWESNLKKLVYAKESFFPDKLKKIDLKLEITEFLVLTKSSRRVCLHRGVITSF